MIDELTEKVMNAKNAEELKRLADEYNLWITDQQIENYFKRDQPGEMSDDELDNVSGGGCHTKDGKLVVSALYVCEDYTCVECGRRLDAFHWHGNKMYDHACTTCKYAVRNRGLLICNK